MISSLGRSFMKAIAIPSLKVTVSFKAGTLPQVDPSKPVIVLDLNGTQIPATITAKAARKLAAHTGSAALTGKLVIEQGRLKLIEAGFQFFDPKPEAGTETPAVPVPTQKTVSAPPSHPDFSRPPQATGPVKTR
jgi:hypothetical protein